jgi:hypothetical protein
MPVRILDLLAEFRCVANGLATPCGYSLLGALAYHGIDGIDVADKEDMRALAMRGGSYTDTERQSLLSYCETDVIALSQLLPAMLPRIDMPRALLRGRYMAAAARMEDQGVPIDISTLSQLRQHWDSIKSRLTREIDKQYGVFVPVGASHIDPQSRLGSAIYQTSAEIDAHPYNLAAALDDVYERYREREAPLIAAELAARRQTGLTVKKIELWEDSGKDHSTFPQLDVTARELAAELPELGLGCGFDDGDGRDHAGMLWDRLREPTDRLKPKHDPEFLAEAAA